MENAWCFKQAGWGIMSGVSVGRPKVVCLCGSLRFGREIATERTRLTLELAIVLAPEATEAAVLDPSLVQALGELHLRRIDLADEVRIVNPGGYIGEATRREIAYANAVGKRVTYLHELAPTDS
ncbi:hypothetical protein [Kribbella sp. CA-247076]|uniref:hypothetical protein n=1 Tax=Kribbella sp. CA-247076 TaxID=3239941 RepID=UPI003D901A6B